MPQESEESFSLATITVSTEKARSFFSSMNFVDEFTFQPFLLFTKFFSIEITYN